MAKKKDDKPKVVLERTYNIPLRKEFEKVPKYKRAKKAVTALRKFLKRHMKSDNIKLGKHLNELVWSNGMRNPPHHVKVSAVKEDSGVIRAELVGKPIYEEEPTPADKKKEDKAAKKEEKAEDKEDKKAEDKKEEKSEAKIEEKTEEKPKEDEKPEEKKDEKTEEKKPEEKPAEPEPEKKPEEKPEAKAEEKAEEKKPEPAEPEKEEKMSAEAEPKAEKKPEE